MTNLAMPESMPHRPAEIIRLTSVTKRFGGVAARQRRVSFAIARGEIHAVVGENGAGKSTIMKMLAGVYQPDSGTIYPARRTGAHRRSARRRGSSASASSSRS